MNDELLSSLQREPPPEFAERLRARLRGVETAPAAHRAQWPALRIAASIGAVAVIGALLTVPSVRASAESLLARFRVVNFVAVGVDEDRIEALRSEAVDLPDIVGEHLQILQEPTPPVPMVSAAQAGAAAGITVRLPAWLPPEVELKEIAMTGPGRLRVRADSLRLEQLMDLLGIDDLEVPSGLDGKVADIRIPSIVRVRYEVNCENCARAEFIQAKSPEITLPDGVDLQVLGEIGLRVLGLPAPEARQFAQSIDWRSTVLVPVPWGATSFKHVEINGNPGIAIERDVVVDDSSDAPGAGAIRRGIGVAKTMRDRVVLWSGDGMVFGLKGSFQTESLLRMAYSVR
jgi:hypothetical protein